MLKHSNIMFSLFRISALEKAFKDEFGDDPLFFGRAPGRVNLIGLQNQQFSKCIYYFITQFCLGEHIDYCGYSVLPMAIEQDVIIAAKRNDKNVLRLRNTDIKYKYLPKFQCQNCVIFNFINFTRSFDSPLPAIIEKDPNCIYHIH